LFVGSVALSGSQTTEQEDRTISQTLGASPAEPGDLLLDFRRSLESAAQDSRQERRGGRREPVTLLLKLGKASPDQSFFCCFERTLYLLAVNGKPSEKSAVTVSVETFADFLKVFGLVGSHV